MRVAIVGAGISGLTCARRLREGGLEVVIFEKSRGLGGRIASRRVGETVVDHGTPDLPGDCVAESSAVLASEAVGMDRPSGRLTTGGFQSESTRASLAFPLGLTRLAKVMAEGLDIRFGVRVAALRGTAGGFEVGDEQGNTHGSFDAVVVTAPAPQAADLLDRSPDCGDRAAALRRVTYAPCVVVIVGVNLPEPEWWFATISDSPLASLAIESAKGRAPIDGVIPVVARLMAEASEALLDSSDEEALAVALPEIARLLGERALAPVWSQVKRWRFAEPTSSLAFDEINPPGCRILVCGDTTAAGVRGAALSGERAAERLLAAQ